MAGIGGLDPGHPFGAQVRGELLEAPAHQLLVREGEVGAQHEPGLVHQRQQRAQVGIEIFGVVFFLLPAACLVLGLSIPIFWESYITHELSSNTEGLIRWPAKLLLPEGFGLLILAGLSHLVKCIGFLRGRCANPMRVSDGKSDEEALVADILAQQRASQSIESAQGR